MREEHLGADTGGAWTRSAALAAGLSHDEIDGRLAEGTWQALRRGVLTDGGVSPSPVMRGWTSVLAAGGPGRAWATGRTTLRMLALPLIDDQDPATGAFDLPHDDVLVRRRVRNRPTLHPTRRTVPNGGLGLVRGCPSTSLPFAMLSAAGALSLEALVCALDAALQRELITEVELTVFVQSVRGQRNAARLTEAVRLADGRAESSLESLGRLVLLPVLPDLVPQVEIFDRGMRLLARVDLGDERRRLAIEGDGRSTHTGMAADDHRRDRIIGAQGWRTERYTWFEVRRRQAALQQRMLAAAARRDPRVA